MNLDNLTHTSGEWLRGSGPESDIVISSRIRLARNLAAFPFTNRASSYQKAEIETLLRDRIAKLELDPKLGYLNVPDAVARSTGSSSSSASSSAASWPPPTGRAASPSAPQETVSLMVNEEDHLRLQVMRSGFTLDEAWQEIDRVDDLLEQRVSYAFSEEFGYLTACPTNVGTGMRASVMLHLPALEHTKQIEKVFRALQKINLAVRGLYGEGSRASGHFYQISNQVTLGKSETHDPQRDPRASSRRSSPTSARPGRRWLARQPPGPAGQGVARLRHALLGDDDDLGRDDGTAVLRPPGHQPAAWSTTSPSRRSTSCSSTRSRPTCRS